MTIEGDSGEAFTAFLGFLFGLLFGIMPTHHLTTEAWRRDLIDNPSTIAAETSMEFYRREIKRLGG